MKDAIMAEVTVKQLADVVGIQVDKLLTQMRDAGLPHENPDDSVSSDQKQVLLGHLKKSHGESGGETKKVTLKRKRLSTLKSSTAASGTRGTRILVRPRRRL